MTVLIEKLILNCRKLRNHNAIPVTAIFDIGKTNKKFLLFDENFKVVHEEFSCMDRQIIEDDDGFRSENLAYLVDWVWEKLRSAVQDDAYYIQKLNFATYGASLVNLDEDGEIATHFYNYLKPYPKDLSKQFYDNYGGKKKFAIETASPPTGMLNSGLQLYWLKYKKPDKFKKIKQTLHFPQYLSSLFTGEYTSEYTSIGCHTGLWNFEEGHYHEWVEQEGIKDLLPELQPTTNTVQSEVEGTSMEVGLGIHDSSAALMPYLLALDEPFMLLSTGTWSIALNAFNDEPLSFEELKSDCLSFMNMQGEQVKAARVFLGNEYSHQKEKLASYFDYDVKGEEVSPDTALIKRLIQEDSGEKKLHLETANTSGPFQSGRREKWYVSQFSTYKEGYHQLMLDLIAIQAESIQLAEGSKVINKIIITGGFSHNDCFVRLLASRFPEKEIYTASLSHASALGAAMVINDDYAQKKMRELLELESHEGLANTDLKSYRWRKQIRDGGNTIVE